MKIQLLYFKGCPHVDAARAALREAVAADNGDAPSGAIDVEEIDVDDPAAPAWARSWGSPTILIDGEDVAGGTPSAASSCRLYASDAPDAAAIRARIAAVRGRASKTRVAWPMIGAITAAIAASACCVIPAALALVGVSGVGFAARLAPYRAVFLVATVLALGIGFWLAYRRTQDACGCAAPRPLSRRAARVGLWISTVLVVAVAAYPMLAGANATAGSADAPAKETLRLAITGMDCKECTSTIANAIKRVPGVVSATVDYASGSAIVRHDGRAGIADVAIEAVEIAGYRAEVRP